MARLWTCTPAPAGLPPTRVELPEQPSSAKVQASQRLASTTCQGRPHPQAPTRCRMRGTVAPQPPVLDEFLICEQTKVDHFWGLDDDGDLKGGNKTATRGNGDLATDAAARNGYICRDCSMLSQRTEALTAHPASQGPSSRVYSRDRNPKRKSHTSKVRKRFSDHRSPFLVLKLTL